MTFSRVQFVAFVAFLAVAAGSLMPWAHFGIFQTSGDDGDGLITLVLGAAGVAFVFVNARPAAALAALAGAAAFGIAAYNATDLSRMEIEVIGSLVELDPEIGVGLMLVVVAGLIAAVASIGRTIELGSKRQADVQAAPARAGKRG